jgi:hypothetical protein
LAAYFGSSEEELGLVASKSVEFGESPELFTSKIIPEQGNEVKHIAGYAITKEEGQDANVSGNVVNMSASSGRDGPAKGPSTWQQRCNEFILLHQVSRIVPFLYIRDHFNL